MRLLNGTSHQRSAAKATCIRHKLAKNAATRAPATTDDAVSGCRFTYGRHSMLMANLQGAELAADAEWEVLFADYPFRHDLTPIHLGPDTVKDWKWRLKMKFKQDPRNFETDWVRRKYTCMPWRYFVALAWICEEELKRPLAYFRVEKPRIEAKERRERARLMNGAGFDINDPNAIPPSADWEWQTAIHPGMGKGTKQYATCWVNTKK